MPPAETELEVRAQAERDFMRLAAPGGYAYATLTVILACCTTYGRKHPLTAATVSLVFIALAAVRFILIWNHRKHDGARRCFIFARVNVIVMAVAWGLVVAAGLHHQGLNHADTLLLLMSVALPASLSLVSFKSHFPVVAANGAALVLPAALVSASIGGGPGYGTAFMLTGFLAYLLTQGKRMSREFRRALDDRLLLRQRAWELEAAHATAQTASRVKSEFLANMSHELRTPMNGIIGMTELALGAEMSAEQRNYLETIKASADSLLSLVNNVLDLSQLENRSSALHESVFEVRPAIAGALHSLEDLARQNLIALSLEIEPGVPRFVSGDAARLRQVLLNLVGNALKFTPRGEVKLEVRTASDSPPSSVPGEVRLAISVTDTGVGIPRDKLAQIFEPFAQADGSTTRRFGGTGLGLTISARLVHLMGGRIDVTSEVGRGSTFSFAVPFRTALDPAPSQPGDVLKRRSLKPLNILLAEDNPVNQRVAARLLEKWGHTVHTAANGKEASLAFLNQDFQLVLMDIHMPEMDGIAATLVIRSTGRGRRTPIVALTAGVQDADREVCAAAGMDGFLGKPVNAAELFDAVEKFGKSAGSAGSLAEVGVVDCDRDGLLKVLDGLAS